MIPIPCFTNRSILILFLIFLIPNVSAVAVTNITQLTHGTDISYGDPSWSSDGKNIVFDKSGIIHIMNADGNNMISTGQEGTNAKWSPDGLKIVFQRGTFIYTMDSNGSNQKMLLAPAYNPSISPDGKYIAFDAGAISIAGAGVDITHIEGGEVIPEMGGGIVVMNIDGTNIKRLTTDLGDEEMPSWSPDGKKIVFVKDGIIFIMNADGSNMLSTEQTGYYPRWSPDGKFIAFLSGRVKGHIYIMNIGGTNVTYSSDHRYRGKAVVVNISANNVTQLTFGNRWDYLLDWSPDGNKIVFSSAVPPTLPSFTDNLYIMTLDFNATSPTATPTVTQTPTFTPTATATQTPRVPGFSLLAAIASLSILVLMKRIKR
jgi:Tol biopolymer transport system component